jgi:hypothetical protein
MSRCLMCDRLLSWSVHRHEIRPSLLFLLHFRQLLQLSNGEIIEPDGCLLCALTQFLLGMEGSSQIILLASSIA